MTKRKKISGFTLVDAMFGIFLLAIAAAIVSATTPIASVSRVKSDQLNRAAGAAEKEIEAIRNAGYANCSASQLATLNILDNANPVTGTTDTFTFTNVDAGVSDSLATILPSGTGTVRIEQADLDLRRVTVTVTWKERGVTTRTYTLGTLLANL